MIKVALIGNPNSGKTTLFNSLTGATAYVGNWPGVTVEKRSGKYVLKNPEETFEIVDLPGIYSLSPYTPEEVISRNFLLNEKPDVVINIVDGTNLERNLYLTTQVLEMDVPMIVAVNMMDAVANNGQTIDEKAMSEALGVPVVPISALKGKGLHDLMKLAAEVSKTPRVGHTVIESAILPQAQALLAEAGVPSPLFHAIKLLEKDELELKDHPRASSEIVEMAAKEGRDYGTEVDRMRYAFLAPLCQKAIVQTKPQEKKKSKLSDKIDRVLTHRVFGFVIMAVALFLMFHLTFSQDFLFLHAMGVDFGEGYAGLIQINFGDAYNAAFGGEVDYTAFAPFAGLWYSDAGISSLGQIFVVIVEGICNLINEGVRAALFHMGASEWAMDFVYSGALGGVFSVIGFLPQILILFALFTFLEDSGYMARIAFMLDRIFHRFGVSGKAFIPMIMGFGCAVPAMMNTRTLSTEKEKAKTIRVIPFFTCSAKNEFLIIIAAFIAPILAFPADLFILILYVAGILVAMASIIVMNRTTMREQTPPFIMELPSYHLPQAKSLAVHVWDKGKHFVEKAFTIILLSTIVLWFFSHFTWDWSYLPDADGQASILGGIGSLIAPLFVPLGFGNVQAGQNAWMFSVASIEGIVAKEGVTAVLESMEADFGVLSTGGLVAFAVFNMLTIPCFASVATARSELNNKKTFLFTLLFWMALSYLVGAWVYITIDFTWTLAITLPILALAIAGLVIYDRIKMKKEAAAA